MRDHGSPRVGAVYVVERGGRRLRFETTPGVFSADAADRGSMLLLDTVMPFIKPHQTVLDLGCGAGIIGLTLAGLLPRGEMWLVDADIRAIRLTERNVLLNEIANAHVVLGDVTADLPRKLKFDSVVSNPPTHDGREVLRQFVAESRTVLRPGGSLWLVVNRLLSIKGLMADAFGNVAVEARDKGFFVLRSEKSRGQMVGANP